MFANRRSSRVLYKIGTGNTTVTSDFRPEIEIWPVRACAMKISRSKICTIVDSAMGQIPHSTKRIFNLQNAMCTQCTVMPCRRLQRLLSWKPSTAVVILIYILSVATVADAYYEKTCTREDRLRPEGVCGQKLTALISTLCQSQYNKRNAEGNRMTFTIFYCTSVRY